MNHSLPRSCANRLRQAGVDEQARMQTTSHKSLAVGDYKETANAQRSDISNIIAGSKRQAFVQESESSPAVATPEALVVNVIVSKRQLMHAT